MGTTKAQGSTPRKADAPTRRNSDRDDDVQLRRASTTLAGIRAAGEVHGDVAPLQRFAGNAALTGLLASEPVLQRDPGDPEASRSFSIPNSMATAILFSDFRAFDIDDIRLLNDDQILDLKRRLDTWKQLYEDTPDFLHQQYKKAKGKADKRQAYDLFLASTKVAHAFKVRYEPVTRRAQEIARGRGFSVPGATFGPKDGGASEFERWSETIESGLSDRAQSVFAAVLPEVTRRLEFLLWDIDYPTPEATSRWYWMRYGYWTAGVIHHVLIGGERRSDWADFGPHLSDAAAPVAAAFHAAITSGKGPDAVIASVESLTEQITRGVKEMQVQADGVLPHGIEDVNIRDLYDLAAAMRDVPGSIWSCFSDAFLYD